MSDAYYVAGSIEWVVIEVEKTLLGVETFDADDWTAEMVMAPLGDAFSSVTAAWVEVTSPLEVVSGTMVRVKAKLTDDLDAAAGSYKVYARLTSTPESAIGLVPVVRASGVATVR